MRGRNASHVVVPVASGWHAPRERTVASGVADSQWQAIHVEALQLGVVLEKEVADRWPGRVHRIRAHSESGDASLFLVGPESLRKEVLSLVPQGAPLQVHYIPRDEELLQATPTTGPRHVPPDQVLAPSLMYATDVGRGGQRTLRNGSVGRAHDDSARHVGQAILDALRALAPVSDERPEWVALDAEAQRRGKTTRQFRAWCVAHSIEIRQDNHRDAWVRPSDIDRVVAEMPVATVPARGDEITQELQKVWPTKSSQGAASRRARARST